MAPPGVVVGLLLDPLASVRDADDADLLSATVDGSPSELRKALDDHGWTVNR